MQIARKTEFTGLVIILLEERRKNQIKAEQLSASSFVFARNETQSCKALKTAALKQTAAHSQLTVSCGFSFTCAKYWRTGFNSHYKSCALYILWTIFKRILCSFRFLDVLLLLLQALIGFH